jgi:hypothetical protein
MWPRAWRFGSVAGTGAAALVVLLGGADARGFGTISLPGSGQNAEHERITRAALACPGGAPSDGTCFEPASLGELAGRPGTFGGVGAPDRDEITNPDAHCDDADFLDRPAYPRSRTQATDTLARCISHLSTRFTEAWIQAREIVPEGDPPTIEAPKVDIAGGCPFSGRPGAIGKCDVLDQFGRALHGAQDFHSHSNWDDRPDGARGIGVDNPPGLDRAGAAPFMILRHLSTPAPPRDLSTGCFTFVPFGCRGRITHGTLNKDTGLIDPVTGATSGASTDRGALHGGANFQRAVSGAIAETRRQWEDLRQQLLTAYGPQRGALIVCAITRDDPINDCQGRRLGIVIDSSGSNQETDPSGLRIAAGQAFNASLVTQAEVEREGRGKPDQSAVISFSDSAGVISALADPSLARFAGIGAFGGTCIACGIEQARAELVGSTDQPPPFRRFGIVVLTDGQDSDVGRIAAAIDAAAAIGIRTSIGFLAPPPNPVAASAAQAGALQPARAVVSAVQRSGGVLATISSARAQRAFVSVALANGLTAVNDVNGGDEGGVLGLGVRVRGRISPRGDVDVWSYRTRRGQKVALTVSGPGAVRAAIRVARTGRPLARARTDRSGRARLILAARRSRLLEVDISSPADSAVNYRIGVSRVRAARPAGRCARAACRTGSIREAAG